MSTTTRIALLSETANLGYFAPLLEAAVPGAQVFVWPDPRCLQAEVAVCWNTTPGLYAQMPNLQLIHSIAAGVDNVVAGHDLRGLPVCRVVDPDLAQGMVEYVLWAVLYFHRNLDRAVAQQRDHVWKRPQLKRAAGFRVGVMGLGELGSKVATALSGFGYPVSGWARSPRELPGITTCAGPGTFTHFLGQTDVLVNLLPLTDATRSILAKPVFDALPKGAAIVGCGRGEHLVEADLADALASGQLRGAVLDVFAQEPLPAHHPLWDMPGVVVTPHMATMAAPEVIVQQVADNIRRRQSSQPLRNAVDTARGY